MAVNEIQYPGRKVTTVLASIASGQAVVMGQVPGVAVAATATDGSVVVDTDGVYELLVDGVNNAGGLAVNVGDAIYYNSGATPKLNVDSTTAGHVLFGYAWNVKGATAPIAPGTQLVASNNHTTTIQVKIARI